MYNNGYYTVPTNYDESINSLETNGPFTGPCIICYCVIGYFLINCLFIRLFPLWIQGLSSNLIIPGGL
jgi:hypothetical protein